MCQPLFSFYSKNLQKECRQDVCKIMFDSVGNRDNRCNYGYDDDARRSF